MTGKSATATDVRLGAHFRIARETAGLTHREVAIVLGYTAAQLQKYGKDTNRTSATDLRLSCGPVRLPIEAFFDRLGPQANAYESATGQARGQLAAAIEARGAGKGADPGTDYAALRRAALIHVRDHGAGARPELTGASCERLASPPGSKP